MTPPTLTLLIDSLQPADGAWPSLPALQQLLSKGERSPLESDYYRVLCGLFGLAGGAQTLPLASLSALGDGLDSSDGWWLRADPVHLVADRDQLYLSAYQTLHISQSEAERLAAELNRTYEEDGWRFHVPHPSRWYLQLPAPLAMQTVPTATAMGSPVREVLPRGEDAMTWQRVMTEIQMVLHASPVNAERGVTGELAVNSLWFWGGGALPEAGTRPEWGQLLTDEPLALGLAQLYGIPVVTAAAGGQTLQIGTARSVTAAEEGVFAPALSRLRNGELQTVELLLPGHGRWRIDRRALRRWWRRSQPLEKLLGAAP
ncbi:MAG TPA: hypothetical protein VIQ22_04220 [Gammaproteobacteria bacterium]